MRRTGRCSISRGRSCSSRRRCGGDGETVQSEGDQNGELLDLTRETLALAKALQSRDLANGQSQVAD